MVQTIIDGLRSTAQADHILVCRLRPVDRVVENDACLEQGQGASGDLYPAGERPGSDQAADATAQTCTGQPNGDDAQAEPTASASPAQTVADTLAARLAET